jgi:hypothetical protein
MLGYWHHLENLESSLLSKAAYNSSKKFFLKKPSWYGSIHYIKKKIPGLEKYLSYDSSTFKQHCWSVPRAPVINFPCVTPVTDTILWEGTLVSAHLNLQLMS